MYLVLSGLDLHQFDIGAFDGSRLVHHERCQTPPEGYLAAIDRVLREWRLDDDTLTGIIVVAGPGSFTAGRVSTTIANTLAFTKDIPVVALENPDRLGLAELLSGAALQPRASVDVSYDRPAHITRPRDTSLASDVSWG